MGKKKKQEKKKKLLEEEKKLLKARKKAEKAARKSKGQIIEVPEEPKLQDILEEPKAEIVEQSSLEMTAGQETSVKDQVSISAKEAMLVFRAMGDETRMEILAFLEEKEMCAVELLQCVKIVQSTLSHHMKILTESGLVVCRRDNKRIYYSICAKRMEEAAEFLKHY